MIIQIHTNIVLVLHPLEFNINSISLAITNMLIIHTSPSLYNNCGWFMFNCLFIISSWNQSFVPTCSIVICFPIFIIILKRVHFMLPHSYDSANACISLISNNTAAFTINYIVCVTSLSYNITTKHADV